MDIENVDINEQYDAEKARADNAERMVMELRDRWNAVKRAYFGSSDPVVAINEFDTAISFTADVAGRWRKVEDGIVCIAEWKLDSLNNDLRVATEAQVNAERMVAELRDFGSRYRRHVDTMMATGKPTGEWSKDEDERYDAALSSTADVAGRWVPRADVDHIAQQLAAIMVERAEIGAERDAAIAARDEAVREGAEADRDHMKALAREEGMHIRMEDAERARDEVVIKLDAAGARIKRQSDMLDEWVDAAVAIDEACRDAGLPYSVDGGAWDLMRTIKEVIEKHKEVTAKLDAMRVALHTVHHAAVADTSSDLERIAELTKAEDLMRRDIDIIVDEELDRDFGEPPTPRTLKVRALLKEAGFKPETCSMGAVIGYSGTQASTEAPDRDCVSTPDGGCVAARCMHTLPEPNASPEQTKTPSGAVVDELKANLAFERVTAAENRLLIHNLTAERDLAVARAKKAEAQLSAENDAKMLESAVDAARNVVKCFAFNNGDGSLRMAVNHLSDIIKKIDDVRRARVGR